MNKRLDKKLIIKNEKLAKQYKKYFIALWNMIPNKYLHYDPSPESLASGNSCNDGIDNDFDHTIDSNDKMCLKR